VPSVRTADTLVAHDCSGRNAWLGIGTVRLPEGAQDSTVLCKRRNSLTRKAAMKESTFISWPPQRRQLANSSNAC